MFSSYVHTKYLSLANQLLCLNSIVVFSVIALESQAHNEITSTYECHAVKSDDEDTDECHCHVPGEKPVKLSCEDKLLSMETLLAIEKVDEDLYFGLSVEPENTCSEYNIADYPYGTTLDVIKARELGGVFSAYEDHCFGSYSDVDIDHLVARKEAHDSGLCAADAQTKLNFSNDLENIALTSPSINRSKSARDPAGWLPEHNACWFVWQHMHIKRKYQLSIDEAEKNAIEKVLQNCAIEDLFLDIDESCTLPEDSEPP